MKNIPIQSVADQTSRRPLPRNLLLALAFAVIALPTAGHAQAPTWVFEESFDGDPPSPSQALLPRRFDYVVTHRQHPQEQFTKAYDTFPADHGADCAGPNPTALPLPQHAVTTSQNSNGAQPDESFFICKNHMMSALGEVAWYSNSAFWPRQAFDFAGGGVLEFEVNLNEGFGQRVWWEVLIVPRDQLRVGPASPESAIDERYPRDRIVLNFSEAVRHIRVGSGEVDPLGWQVDERQFNQYDWAYWGALHPSDPALSDRRIRRTMRITLNANQIAWGIEMADGNFDTFSVDLPEGLPFDRGLVLFKTHAYTPTGHGNFDTYTFHWDNIRFTGPAVGRYRAWPADSVVYLQRNGSRPIGDIATVNVSIDELGENPVLFGQLHGLLRGQALVSVNGGPEMTVNPEEFALGDCVSGEWRDWKSFRLPLDPSALRTGVNTLRWRVGPRPACAQGQDWWDGYSVKFLQIQTDEVSSGDALLFASSFES